MFRMKLGDHWDARKTEWAEMIKTQERIAAKVFNGKRIKFPAPAYHLLLVDARGYLRQGGDCFDWLQMSLGAEVTDPVDPSLVKFWADPHTKVRSAIRGLFEVSNPTRAATFVQERIHFIEFVCEEAIVMERLLSYCCFRIPISSKLGPCENSVFGFSLGVTHAAVALPLAW